MTRLSGLLRTSAPQAVLKIAGLGVLDALALFWCILFVAQGNWLFLGLVSGGTLVLNVLALSRKSYPFRYLAPGWLFLILMVVYPMGYNVYISVTNYATGHYHHKEDAIKLITRREFTPPSPLSFSLAAFGTERELYAVLLEGEERRYVAFPDGTLSDPEEHELVDEDGDGRIDELDGRARLQGPALTPHLGQLQAIRIPYERGWLRMATLREFRKRLPQYVYDEERDVMVDQRTGMEYAAAEDRFIGPEGERLDPGWRVYVGLENYARFFADPRYHGAFLRVMGWTFAFAILSVAFSFALGLALANLLNDSQLRFRKLYRSLLIIPYALPAVISILIWRGFYNVELGLFNQILSNTFNITVPWLRNPFWARFSIILTNVWLTYPYMLLVSLGALQSIPGELYEAARVDGAGGWQRFRNITFPLLMITVAPLLIGSFAISFNNFTLIWLLTEGRPAVEVGARAGSTDILLSYAYRLAFEGARGNEWSMAAALSIMIFVIVIIVSGVSFLRTKALEDISGGL